MDGEGLDIRDILWNDCVHVYKPLVTYAFCMNAVVGLPRPIGEEETRAGFH